MIGLGTIINTAAVIVGSGIGLGLKNGLPERLRETLTKSCGLSVIMIGIAGALEGMLDISGGAVSSTGSMMLVLSLVIGAFFGELINIEDKLDRFSEWLKKKANRKNDAKFVDGFVNASLVICIGAMAVVGSIQDGLSGDYSMLLAKSVLDFVIVMVFSSSFGIGVMFSALTVLVYQGLITVFAFAIHGILSEALIANMSYIGSVMIMAVGINLLFGKKINVGNLLPALLVPVVYEILQIWLPI